MLQSLSAALLCALEVPEAGNRSPRPPRGIGPDDNVPVRSALTLMGSIGKAPSLQELLFENDTGSAGVFAILEDALRPCSSFAACAVCISLPSI